MQLAFLRCPTPRARGNVAAAARMHPGRLFELGMGHDRGCRKCTIVHSMFTQGEIAAAERMGPADVARLEAELADLGARVAAAEASRNAKLGKVRSAVRYGTVRYSTVWGVIMGVDEMRGRGARVVCQNGQGTGQQVPG